MTFGQLLRGARNSLHLIIDFFSHMRILHLEACFWLDLSTGQLTSYGSKWTNEIQIRKIPL